MILFSTEVDDDGFMLFKLLVAKFSFLCSTRNLELCWRGRGEGSEIVMSLSAVEVDGNGVEHSIVSISLALFC